MKNGIIIMALALLFFTGCSKSRDSLDGDCEKNSHGLSTGTVTLGKDASTKVVTATNSWWTMYVAESSDNFYNNDDNFEIICLEDDCMEEDIKSCVIDHHRLKVIGDWFEVAETSKKELSISVTENETGEARSLYIGVHSRNCTSRVTVTQKAN